MNRITALKVLQPDVQIWVAVGGWAFSDPWMPTATTFSDIARSQLNQDKFISSLIRLMNKYSLDGVDIDWEYPVADDHGGKKEDYDNFVPFIKRLRLKLGALSPLRGGMGISLTLPASYWCKFFVRP